MKLLNRLKRYAVRIRPLRDFYVTHLKRFDGKIRVYLTMQCNLRCGYCVNQIFKKDESRIEDFVIADGSRWISAINRERRDVVFTGGEPTLHPDFIEILNNIDTSLRIWVYTNFKWSEAFLENFLAQARRVPIFYGSYHYSSGDPANFAKVISTLKKYDKFSGTIHTVDSRYSGDSLKKALSYIEAEGIEIKVDSDQFGLFKCASRAVRRKVRCSKRLILIAPDGSRYQCVSRMVRMQHSLENLFEAGLGDEMVVSLCRDYGYCAPCDGLGDAKFKFMEGE